MKKTFLLFFTLFLISEVGFSQDRNWAVGLKIGEPLGLNVRKYFNDGDKAFDFNVGSYGFLYGRNRTYKKKSLYEEAGIMFQGILHYNRVLGRNDKVNVYYGYGGQINSRNVPLEQYRDKIRIVSFGPAVNAGIELALPENDLSVFLDAGGYGEIAPKPFFFAANLNLGLRLNIQSK
jgi:hypothetical protein